MIFRSTIQTLLRSYSYNSISITDVIGRTRTFNLIFFFAWFLTYKLVSLCIRIYRVNTIRSTETLHSESTDFPRKKHVRQIGHAVISPAKTLSTNDDADDDNCIHVRIFDIEYT